MPGDVSVRRIVLLVDDSPETLGLLVEALEDAGLTALVAREGNAALALLDRVQPDLILLDAVMPGIHGFDLCRRIKAREDVSAVPIVFMTGLSDSAHVVEGLRAGGVDYVTKPLNIEELIARISVHIANARLVADARSALDAAGQAVFALSPEGRISWASPRAAEALRRAAGGTAESCVAALPGLGAWLADARDQPLSRSAALKVDGADGRRIRLSVIGRSAVGDLLVRVDAASSEPQEVTLSRALGLSLREAEVLGWLAEGKSNRDIAAILNLSPRTVTKHVEQIFAKLNVENRTSAAAICLRHLSS